MMKVLDPTPSAPAGVATPASRRPISVKALLEESGARSALDRLGAQLVGLAPVKARILGVASLLLMDRLRESHGLRSSPPCLHMCFTGNPGTGKTTVALRMADVLQRLGFAHKGHLVAVTRDDLVGRFPGHGASRTREIVEGALGGVLFIDDAHDLYRPGEERDPAQDSIEVLLQMMERHPGDLVVILAAYKDRMDRLFGGNPGLSSRIAHHIHFPDYSEGELMQIAQTMLGALDFRFDPAAADAFARYVGLRKRQPRFANGRSIRNALDRMRLRQAARLASSGAAIDGDDLRTLRAEDVVASRVFAADPCAGV